MNAFTFLASGFDLIAAARFSEDGNSCNEKDKLSLIQKSKPNKNYELSY